MEWSIIEWNILVGKAREIDEVPVWLPHLQQSASENKDQQSCHHYIV